ncbi:histidinol-phosphatase [Chitinasiproducens palmae]|uniref:HAD-superfamily subfamily IB hydrolase, TIGR01490 n=1 Tax=Chitinasiproducens palmae TaxID=1770053 RepID=A0A1H2PRE4_9BURK|nr:HAD family hydrolase [Chitinasiproducens palmae]SDV49451.1 HAD-superfamily subfamily IB hydrolase, TIGR01490 [Chitinasiproducens palmae]
MKRLALFDLDHTLIPTDSDHAWGRFMVEEGMVERARFERENLQFYEDYKAGCLDIDAYLRVALEPLSRYSRAELDRFHARFMAEVIAPQILPVARQLVDEHRKAGDLCCVVTATNAFVTRPIAQAFGIEHLIAVDPATEGDLPEARYTGLVKGMPSFQAGKIVRTEGWLAAMGLGWGDFEKSFFYSDSRNDIPLLEKVSDPVATNPDDTLRAHAERLGWPILELFKAT